MATFHLTRIIDTLFLFVLVKYHKVEVNGGSIDFTASVTTLLICDSASRPFWDNLWLL